VTFDRITRTLTGTPPVASTGVHVLRIRVTDAKGLTCDVTQNLVVAVRANHAPVPGLALPSLLLVVGQAWTWTVPAEAFTDADQDSLTWAVEGAPAWMNFDPTTRTLSGTPPTGSKGTKNLTVKVQDSLGAPATATLTCVVSDPITAPVSQTLASDPIAPALTGIRTFNIAKDSDLDLVPWAKLLAGDVVNIHRKADGSPYRSFIRVRGQGTSIDPIIINGVTDAQGRRPVFSGDGATVPAGCMPGGQDDFFSRTQSLWYQREGSGLIATAVGIYQDPQVTDPTWVRIQNLEVREVGSGYFFTDARGFKRRWRDPNFATIGTAISVKDGEDIHVINCVMRDSDLGLATVSAGNTLISAALRTVVRANRFEGNGLVGTALGGNLDLHSVSPVVEFNYFGPTKVGALCPSVRSRSSGDAIRYNWLDCGAGGLDLSHSKGSWEGVAAQADYPVAHVYGNVLANVKARQGQVAPRIVGLGGDLVRDGGASKVVNGVTYPDFSGLTDSALTVDGRLHRYRHTLYFYGNTVVTGSDVADRDRVTLFDLALSGTESQPRTTAYEWGNLYVSSGTSVVQVTKYAGNAYLFGSVWSGAGVEHCAPDAAPRKLAVIGSSQPSNPVDLQAPSTWDFRPTRTEGNPALGAPARPNLPPTFKEWPVEYQVLGPTNGGSPRGVTTKGALEPV
jgi:hypothetical protein